MSMETAIYVSMGILTLWAFAMVVWAVWSKQQEDWEFSILDSIRHLKINQVQYKQFASGAQIMMYLYAFLGGVAWGEGRISMVIACGATFLALQSLLLIVRFRCVSKFGNG